MLLAESFGLAFLGAAAGGLLFVWLTRLLRSISLPANLGSLNLSLGIDVTVGLIRARARRRHRISLRHRPGLARDQGKCGLRYPEW